MNIYKTRKKKKKLQRYILAKNIIFSVSPEQSKDFIAERRSPIWVNFLQAKWNDFCCKQAFAIFKLISLFFLGLSDVIKLSAMLSVIVTLWDKHRSRALFNNY